MKQPEKKLHAKYSASGSERWLNCPGSIKLAMKAPPSVDSVYSIEGTNAHTCFEVIMKSKNPRVAAVMLKKQYPEDMVNHVFRLYQKIKELVPEGAELLCETEVRLDFVREGMFGTVDAAIVDLFGTLWVIDLKYGKGRLVSADFNTQMIYYGLGIAHKYNYNFANVKLVVAQPRILHKDGDFRDWDIDVLELKGWSEKFKAGVEACEKPNAPLKVGRWCFFCPAKDICPVGESEAFAEAQNDFDDNAD